LQVPQFLSLYFVRLWNHALCSRLRFL
jgi:hypothetical protein